MVHTSQNHIIVNYVLCIINGWNHCQVLNNYKIQLREEGLDKVTTIMLL